VITRTERVARARKVRKLLSHYVSLQKPYMREHVRKEWGSDPDYSAINALLMAKHELTVLIQDLDGPEIR